MDLASAIIASMGIPKSVLEGGPYSGYNEALRVYGTTLEDITKQFAKNFLTPIMREASNPYKFWFLGPLGKKVYKRMWHKTPKVMFK